MDKGGSGIGAICPGGGDREESRCACGRTLDMVEVHVTPTTGGQFQLRVAASDSVDYLRRLVSKRLRVPKERICLLYRDRHLRAGTLQENYIMDGSRITLLPSVETGLLTQRPEQSVMQALESLNDGQVNDFLTGKAPLNLTMRLGDHMMLIQLQLSTVSPTSNRKSSSRVSSSSSSTSSSSTSSSSSSSSPSSSSSSSSSSASISSSHHHYHHHHHHLSHHQSSSSSSSYVSHSGPYGSPSSNTSPPPSPTSLHNHHLHHGVSPQSQSFFSTPPHHHYHHQSPHSRPSSLSSPSSPTTSNSSPSSPSFLAFDTDFPIRGCPHQTGTSDPKASLDTKALAEASRNLTQTLKQLSSEVLTTKPSPEKETVKQPVPDRRSTPERNTYTSSPNFSGKSRRQGAIIESMHHHGKGVYSGTFSGTLNPALQDRQGRPKRDISTIIHILNDLLCATPQYRRHSSSTSSSSSSTSSAGSTSSSSSNASQNNVHNNQSKSQSNAGTSSTTTTTTQVLGVSTTIGTTSDEESSTDDNQVTRTKLEHLRFIMEQRRARRKARREARASPYAAHSSTTTSWSSETTTLVASKSTSANNSSRGEGGTQGLDVEGKEKEGNDSAALCELNTGTVVA